MTFRGCQQPSSTSINLSDNAECTETAHEMRQTEGMETNKPASFQVGAAKQIIAKAISICAPAYNSGDIQKCAFRRQFDSILEHEVPFMPGSENDKYTLENGQPASAISNHQR